MSKDTKLSSQMIKKIKIVDNDELRNEIDSIYSSLNQVSIAKWALELAKHIILITNLNASEYPEIQEGFDTNELWQKGKARMYDVRQISFKIHRIAREQDDELSKNIFRVIGHAVASGHMKEHAMVASDYAIKVIDLLYMNDLEKIKEERMWQFQRIKELSL
ncbi:MAG: hypothetical protein K2J85_07590 [Anaeroplasmataceae bacterium]|nr:hypothetical protein [Anaeroplasmataceae bacterium]